MRVLVLRAQADAARTADRLRLAGHEALLSPVIEIVATGAPLPSTPVDVIIATSAHALAGVSQLPTALAGATWLVVGERLRDALAERGFGEPEYVATDVADLIAALDARYPEPFRFLYLAGRDRKGALENALRANGHDVAIVETYAARAVSALAPGIAEALQRGAVDVVLHFSRRSADLFVQLAGDAAARHPDDVRHIAISADAAAPLAAQGWQVEIAQQPDEDAMLAMLHEI